MHFEHAIRQLKDAGYRIREREACSKLREFVVNWPPLGDIGVLFVDGEEASAMEVEQFVENARKAGAAT